MVPRAGLPACPVGRHIRVRQGARPRFAHGGRYRLPGATHDPLIDPDRARGFQVSHAFPPAILETYQALIAEGFAPHAIR